MGAEGHRFLQQVCAAKGFVKASDSERVGHSDFGLSEHKAKAIALILLPVALGFVVRQRCRNSRYFRGTVLEAEEHLVRTAVSDPLTPSGNNPLFACVLRPITVPLLLVGLLALRHHLHLVERRIFLAKRLGKFLRRTPVGIKSDSIINGVDHLVRGMERRGTQRESWD